MKLFPAIGLLFFTLAFCGIGDKLKQMSAGNSGQASNTASTNSGSKTASSSDSSVEKPKPTAAQQAIMDTATETTWPEQGISWKLPSGWKKMSVMKESLNYGSPATGFLIASISVMPDNFPSETSIDATYTSALEQLKQGKYENVRWLEGRRMG